MIIAVSGHGNTAHSATQPLPLWFNLSVATSQVSKVGDRVRCTVHYNDTAWPKGFEFIVERIECSMNGYEVMACGVAKNGCPGSIYLKDCELIPKETKMSVNYHVLNESVVLNFNGKTEVVSSSDGRYNDILDCIREGRLDDIPAVVDIAHGFKDSGFELKDGVLYQGEQAIPTELNDRILKFKDQGLPFDSLLKFWDNLKANPSYNARRMLFAFLEHNVHCLTQDGCFIAYRGVTEDFRDNHTGEWDNTPGKVCEMARDLVDDNPNNTCSAGLHVACFDYAKGFGSRLVEVKVNPRDVVCVPTDYNGTKMRTCRFEVVAECVKMRTEELYGHDKTEISEYDEEQQQTEEERGEALIAQGECPNCGSTDQHGAYCSECGVSLD